MHNNDVHDCDPDAANATAYDVAVQKIFRRLDIPWQWILDRLMGVVCDGATVMGPYVAMGRELIIVLQNLDAALKHLPEYISAEGDAPRKAKAAEPLAALSNNLFRVSAAFFSDVFTIACAGSKLVQANRGVTIDAVRGMVNVMCSQLAHLRTHVFEGGWESRLCVDQAINRVRGSRACFLNALICKRGSLRAIGLTLTAYHISLRLALVHVSVCLNT